MKTDRDLVMEAPIGKSWGSMNGRERALYQELLYRSGRYPHKLDADVLAVLIRRVVSDPESLFTVVSMDEPGGTAEIEVAFTHEYASQWDVVVVVESRGGEELVAYRPWR